MSLFFLGLKKELLKLHEDFEVRASKEKKGMVKIAFDTRRINSETQVNPRRNLQNYQRSEPYITPEISNKIKSLFKVKTAADLIKQQFIGDPDWLDSNSRILCNAVDNALRVEQKDYDFFKSQFDYLDELLYLRYRLASTDIENMAEEEIKNILLGRDEKLMHKSLFAKYTPKDPISKVSEQPIPIVKQPSYIQEDSLMEKLFGNVKATSDNPSIKRTISITIDDQINKPVKASNGEEENKGE